MTMCINLGSSNSRIGVRRYRTPLHRHVHHQQVIIIGVNCQVHSHFYQDPSTAHTPLSEIVHDNLQTRNIITPPDDQRVGSRVLVSLSELGIYRFCRSGLESYFGTVLKMYTNLESGEDMFVVDRGGAFQEHYVLAWICDILMYSSPDIKFVVSELYHAPT